MDEVKRLLAQLEKFKYPLLILLAGVLLMLLPLSPNSETAESGPDQRLEELLAHARGAGETHVLLSESGVVVVCRGADNAEVRLDMIRAVRSYTGFGSDKITILKLAD